MRKMKTTKTFALMAVALTVLCGCSGDEERAAGGYPQDGVVRLTVGVNDALTRASHEADGSSVTEFGVSVRNAGATDYTYNNVRVTGSNATGWTPGVTMLWQNATQADGTWTSGSYLKWGEAPVTYRAWYPGDVDGNSFEQGTLKTDQSTLKALAQSDYMTCEQAVTTVPDSRTLTLAMERRMALVTVRIERFNSQFDGGIPTISSISVCSQYASVPATAGSVTAITPYRSSGDGGAGTTYSAIVAPGDGAADEAFIRLTVAYGDDQTTPELIV